MGSNPTLSAIESRAAETFPIHIEFDREKPAIPRGFAKIGFLKRTGDGGFAVRMKPRNAFFSTAMLDGSLSLSIRPSGFWAQSSSTASSQFSWPSESITLRRPDQIVTT